MKLGLISKTVYKKVTKTITDPTISDLHSRALVTAREFVKERASETENGVSD